MIDDLIADKQRLLRTIERMRSKKLSVGEPRTIPIDIETIALITAYENSIREIDAMIALIEDAQKEKRAAR